jgi:DNA-binding MarR family transcriptional regulator
MMERMAEMTSTARVLRVVAAQSLPLRLAELLCKDGFGDLDGIDKPIYHSAMNQSGRVPPTTISPPDSGATLFSFLEVAEQLYEKIAEALARVGLSYAKYEVLQHLHDAGEAVSLGILAEGQRCARSNITQLIDRLEVEGLVRRVDDPDDRRSVRAELTPEGATRAREGATQLDLVRAQFAASFNGSDRAELSRLLAMIR